MIEIEIPVPASSDPGAIERLVDSACAASGLRPTMKGTLRKHPGSIHWHFKRGREAGVLEATYWQPANRLWLSVQDGRVGTWTAATAADLAATLARLLNGDPDAN